MNIGIGLTYYCFTQIYIQDKQVCRLVGISIQAHMFGLRRIFSSVLVNFQEEGYDQKNKREIAIKKINDLNNLKNAELFKRQIRVMKTLQHQNIIQYYGDEVIQNQGYIFVQLCQRENMKKQILKKLTEEQTYTYFKQLVDGMSHINSMRIFHRDLKPQNLLVSLKGNLKIADFGIARDILQQSSQYTPGMCSVFYSAPEILQHAEYNQKCDVYSAGYILFEMLTCETIFQKYLKSNQNLVAVLLEQKRNGGWVIEHPTLIHKPHWVRLLKGMLEFEPQKRLSFEKIKQQLAKIYPTTSKPIFRTVTEEDQYSSSECVKRIENYLFFRIKKQNYLVNMLKVLNQYQYRKSEMVPNIYKTLLLFVTLLRYCQHCNRLMQQLNKRQTKLVISGEQFEEIFKHLMIEDKQRITKFLDERARCVNLGKQNIKRYVVEQILPQLQKKVMVQKQRQFKMIFSQQLPVFMRLLEKFKLNGEGQNQELIYRDLTEKLVNDVYSTSLQLQYSDISDLKIYFILLIVKNYDRSFSWQNQKKFNIPPEIQQIGAMRKSQLIRVIELLKKNQIVNWKAQAGKIKNADKK